MSCGDSGFATLGRNLGELSLAQALDMVGAVEPCGLELLEVLDVCVADVGEQKRPGRDNGLDRLYDLQEIVLVVGVHAHEPQAVEVSALGELAGALDNLFNRHGHMLGKAGS